jgi:hypothetical protein
MKGNSLLLLLLLLLLLVSIMLLLLCKKQFQLIPSLPRTGGCGGRRIAVITSYFSITCRGSIVHFHPFIKQLTVSTYVPV